MKNKNQVSLETLLQHPPPRPLKPILSSPLVLKIAFYTLGSFAFFGGAILDMQYLLIDHFGEPILGNERVVSGFFILFICVIGFVVFWYSGLSDIYYLYLYRKGKLVVSTVEKSSVHEIKQKKYYTVNWITEENGNIIRSNISVSVYNIPLLDLYCMKGEKLLLLSSEKDLGDATVAQLMGLTRKPEKLGLSKPPKILSCLIFTGIFLVVICAGLAIVGFSSSLLLDNSFPLPLVAGCAFVGVLITLPFWIVKKDIADLLTPSRTTWIAILFTAGFFASMGLMKGLNVWMVKEEPEIHTVEVVSLQETFFPQIHFYAFVKSWRPGRIKEKIPLLPWKSYALKPGKEMKLSVVNGALGLTAITKIEI